MQHCYLASANYTHPEYLYSDFVTETKFTDAHTYARASVHLSLIHISEPTRQS